MLLDRRSVVATTPLVKKTTSLSEQIQSRALWRLRASLAETESFSDFIRMEHFASSPEVPSSMASFESNATPATSGDRRAGLRRDGDGGAVRTPDCQYDVTTPSAAAATAAATVSAGLTPNCNSETRRQAFRRAIAQRWTAARFDGDRRPQTSFDSMETDGDASDTSCRPEVTTTSFDSTTTTTTTTTDNTDEVDGGVGVQASRSQHDSGYRSVEVYTLSSALYARCDKSLYVELKRSNNTLTELHKALTLYTG